jgi:signal transduction histidine kinase
MAARDERRERHTSPGSGSAGLALHITVAALIAFVCTLIWGMTGLGGFWPVWVWFALSVPVTLHALGLRGWAARGDRLQMFRVRVELCAAIGAYCVVIWVLAGGGYFWPAWPIAGMVVAMAVRGLFVYGDSLPWLRRRALAERVDVLTRTRRGALDVQAAELRRIERDLHDGAQARLVSLSMLLGRAEDRLGDRPDVAALMREARGEASAAIGELRDLARGIAPPVLADRGLVSAAEALAARAPMDVTVKADDGLRPPPVVETAAYFVVAEALTNAAKHALGAPAYVTISRRAGWLDVLVADEGPGGADATGSGITGLRHRVEALDGTLTVHSPPGSGTTILAELPCAS